MWSDRTPPERLRELVAELRAVLPDASVLSLQRQAGFAYLGRQFFDAPLASFTYWGGYSIASGPGGTRRLQVCGFEMLDAMLEAWRGTPGAMLVGFLSYDLAAEIEDLGPAPRADFTFPKFYFGLYPSAASVGRLSTGGDPVGSSGPLDSRPDRAGFEASVARTVARIHAGEIFQTNLCRCINTAIEPGTEWELFRRMRAISPARYEAFLRIDDQRAVLSISPELFLKADGGIVESAPIKGTRPRGRTTGGDDALLAELRSSEKDRAELAMIVDVVRNDLGRVCRIGSVNVVEHAVSMSLPTVHHLYSTVRGRLRQDTGIVDLLRAAFPAASISGAPKIEAMRVAMREEGQLRGPCMGAIGWISLDGRMEMSVAIRTAFVSDGKVRYLAGCGITSGSNPAAEFEESRHKAAAFIRALGREEESAR